MAAAAGSVSGVLLQAADYTAASLPHTPSTHTRPHWKVDDRGEVGSVIPSFPQAEQKREAEQTELHPRDFHSVVGERGQSGRTQNRT